MERKFKVEGTNITRTLNVVDENIIGTPTNNDLFMVVWQRSANSGIFYVWAKDENDAYDIVGYNPKFVKHTIVKIDPKNMPVCVGVAN